MNTPLDLDAVRLRLAEARGKHYWRSLEELADTEAFQELLHREFPQGATEWTDPLSRRQFLTLMGASLALAGLTGCSRPTEKILPYVRQPEEIIPGKPLFFATAMTLGGLATGLLVESHEGRPTKVEGNPDHPASLGATDAFAQAAVLGLYDPDRSQSVAYLGRIRGWSDAVGALRTAMSLQREKQGAGLRILTETVGSPTLAAQLQALLKDYPAAKWHQYEPAGTDSARAGARLAFGADVGHHYRFDKADVVLSLEADFLSCGPAHLRYVRDFTARRRVRGDKADMNRLYVVECELSPTGAVADHRLPLRAGQVEGFALHLAATLGVRTGPPNQPLPPGADRWGAAVARDLQQHKGSSLIVAGDQQPAAVHALAHGLNNLLGNAGKTVIYTDPVEARPVDQTVSLRELVQDMDEGRVEVLLILGDNPVFTAPVDLHFAESLAKVPLRVHLGLYNDETAAQCHWHIPEAHFLESWSDARAFDGTASIVQPLIAPLYNGKSAHELLAALGEQPDRTAYEIVQGHWRDYWRQQGSSGDFDSFWQRSVHDGVIAGTALPPKQVSLKPDWAKAPATPQPSDKGLEIIFRPDPALLDGRFANNGWLQELPRPITKLTWDNAAIVSPTTAKQLGVGYAPGNRSGGHGQTITDVVELRYGDRTVKAPVWIQPGHADDTITIHLGHGRTRAGKVGTGTGFNAYLLRTSEAPWIGQGVSVRKTGERYQLACVQFHHLMEGRDLIRAGTLAEYRKNPSLEPPKPEANPATARESRAERPEKETHGKRVPLSLYPGFEYHGYKWGMSIDLSACVGCSACVVACQAENNIPVVGKPGVLQGREMHWLRIDSYYEGNLDNPKTYFQPVPCMQCENAPCELVCPVEATAHSDDGLNDMVYNRCVGTRYCSNNCPYKVRRFNFLQYSDYATQSLRLMYNPDVTVRSRGVMEKCTYCVQRIRNAQMEADKQGRRVRDGEILTACQAACPASAIIFGDINDAKSEVAQLKAEPRDYALLAELNTRPRTTYLAAVRNPNPELEAD
jgi:MoCo/4Fe-4S cofactor protein with predicted Tat translocation signal